MSIMERGGGINATVVPTREASEEELMEASDAFYSQHQSLYGVDHLL